jgi:purine-binding chemotaxis protein CheW
MNKFRQLVVFRLDERRYALSLHVVDRIVRATEVTPLPNAPAIVLGVINVGGRVLPVLNTRHRCRLPPREINPADQFLIAQTGNRTVVLVIDQGEEVIELPTSQIVDVAQIAPGLEQIHGVMKLSDGLVLIHDLDNFLSLEEERALDAAINVETGHEA